MKYTDLIFDLYGTLVDIHTDETEEVWQKTALYFQYYGADYTGDSLKTDYMSEISRRESVAGQDYEMFPDIPFDAVMADLFRAKGISENADLLGLNAAHLFRISSLEYIRLYDHVLDALEKFRQQGFRLWLLSNAQRAFTAYELRLLGLHNQFDGIYLSSDYTCRKPDPRFFQALFNSQHLIPAQCLMIGNDRSTDIAGAKSVGLSTLYMHTNLTPADQETACADLYPAADSKLQHYEFEGHDWNKLASLICLL